MAGGTCIVSPRRGGRAIALITPGDFDVIGLVEVDQAVGLGVFHGLSQEPHPGVSLPGQAGWQSLERVSPAGQPGTHEYQISPDARWAIHRYSAWQQFRRPTLIRLPGHERVRMLAENTALRKKLDELKPVRSSFSASISAAESSSTAGVCFRLSLIQPRSIRCSFMSTASRPARRCSTAGAAATNSGTGCLRKRGIS